jgi:cyclophilin family peptidyl-prolyl cis-trans isomerase/HEAT repeat protein
MGTAKCENPLISALKKENNAQVLSRIMEALGKCGSAISLDSILVIAIDTTKKISLQDIGLTIARFAIRQIKSEKAIRKCFELLYDNSSIIQANALYALWRSASNDFIDYEISTSKNRLLELSKVKAGSVRMNLAILIGKSKSKDALQILNELEAEELKRQDWHVQVQIVRAYQNYASLEKETINKINRYLTHTNDHVKIATIQTITLIPREVLVQSDENGLLKTSLQNLIDNPSTTEPVKGEAFVTMGKHFPEIFRQYLTRMDDQKTQARIKAKLLEGVSQQVEKDNLNVLLKYLDHDSVRVAMSAWDFIRRMLTNQSMQTMKIDIVTRNGIFTQLFQKTTKVLLWKDMGIATVVANLYSDTSIYNTFQYLGLADQLIEVFISAFDNFTHPDDSEAKQSLLNAMGQMRNELVVPNLEKALKDPDIMIAKEASIALNKITGKDYSERINTQKNTTVQEDDWILFEQIKKNQNIRIETSKGSIILEMFKEQAPFTVLKFFKLVKKGFYNGLNFHRVVPDFVVQGGDPRGDGWGGPGYTMRTEVAPINYGPGFCGMASAGKDTEGCQFFITHISTPHLDGRYTIFGKVSEGMEIVDSLQIGDTIKMMQAVE